MFWQFIICGIPILPSCPHSQELEASPSYFFLSAKPSQSTHSTHRRASAAALRPLPPRPDLRPGAVRPGALGPAPSAPLLRPRPTRPRPCSSPGHRAPTSAPPPSSLAAVRPAPTSAPAPSAPRPTSAPAPSAPRPWPRAVGPAPPPSAPLLRPRPPRRRPSSGLGHSAPRPRSTTCPQILLMNKKLAKALKYAVSQMQDISKKLQETASFCYTDEDHVDGTLMTGVARRVDELAEILDQTSLNCQVEVMDPNSLLEVGYCSEDSALRANVFADEELSQMLEPQTLGEHCAMYDLDFEEMWDRAM
ncbi:hypothetical protein GUJ93_ZPchr0008g11383 [Zizania palustris]|uniref:Uncharacterized protein n=1 Tax=Zizania palustris TaxID=103762 RepID=A0A8J5RDN8_ZIZPA|nr:hypothetical protein GUJ93_ZPchr0008g11383 [Zizania palustris]